MENNEVQKITPEVARTLPGMQVLKTDNTHYNTKAFPSLLKNMGIQISADEEIKRLRKSVEALTASVKSYGGNPEKILRNAGV